jgi:alkyldihydroxyacetonephosphate synthase
VNDLIDHRIRQFWTADGPDAAHLPVSALRWLTTRIGALTVNTVIPQPTVPASALAEAVRDDFVALVGKDNVLLTPEERLGRAGGLSYLDLLRRRGIGTLEVPDAVVLPADPAQVQRVIDICVRHDIGVIPFGGGTSVVGGVNAVRGD